MYTKHIYSYSLRDVIMEVVRGDKEEYKLAKRIFIKFFEKMIKEIVVNAYQLKIPYNLGSIHLKAVKGGLFIDRAESMRQKKKVYFNNEDTMRFGYMLVWKIPFNMPNKKVYKFKKGNNLTAMAGKLIAELKKERRLPKAFEVTKAYIGYYGKKKKKRKKKK